MTDPCSELVREENIRYLEKIDTSHFHSYCSSLYAASKIFCASHFDSAFAQLFSNEYSFDFIEKLMFSQYIEDVSVSGPVEENLRVNFLSKAESNTMLG
ncbi:MAG: hypothetical protein P4M11_15350 [Candidatus Pacebacteria bacterium]|nr:hypothetical protein [Candidatus Paceibacterota bacterium]